MCTPLTDWNRSPLIDVVTEAQRRGPGRSPPRDELWVRLEQLAAGYVRRRLKRYYFDAHEIEDAVQDVLIGLVLAVDRYVRTDAPPEHYFGVVANRKIASWITERNAARLASVHQMDEPVDRRCGPPGGRFDFPSEVPKWVRAVLVLRSDGYGIADIARIFATSPQALRQTIHRALRDLRHNDE